MVHIQKFHLLCKTDWGKLITGCIYDAHNQRQENAEKPNVRRHQIARCRMIPCQVRNANNESSHTTQQNYGYEVEAKTTWEKHRQGDTRTTAENVSSGQTKGWNASYKIRRSGSKNLLPAGEHKFRSRLRQKPHYRSWMHDISTSRKTELISQTHFHEALKKTEHWTRAQHPTRANVRCTILHHRQGDKSDGETDGNERVLMG